MVDATSGRVLGIVTSKIVGEQIEGLSFGVVIDDALRVVGRGRHQLTNLPHGSGDVGSAQPKTARGRPGGNAAPEWNQRGSLDRDLV